MPRSDGQTKTTLTKEPLQKTRFDESGDDVKKRHEDVKSFYQKI